MSVFGGLFSQLGNVWRESPGAAIGALVGLIGGWYLQGPAGAVVGFLVGAAIGWGINSLMKPKTPA